MALARRKNNPPAPGRDESNSREQVLPRYRQLREISRLHHHSILDCVSPGAFLQQARRLGLANGKTLVLDDLDELNYVNDLVIHTAAEGRSRAIDRFANSANFPAESDEALVLAAMRAASFTILVIEQRHESAGLIAIDMARNKPIWLVDMGLEASMPKGAMLATRLFTPERFSMTAGVNVPLDMELMDGLDAELPQRLAELPLDVLIDDRRFAETIYQIALASGISDRMIYQELPQDP